MNPFGAPRRAEPIITVHTPKKTVQPRDAAPPVPAPDQHEAELSDGPEDDPELSDDAGQVIDQADQADQADHDRFWEQIEKIGWKNAGEHRITAVDIKRIEGLLLKLEQHQREMFVACYNHYKRQLLERIEAHGLLQGLKKSVAVSHVVALGRDTYNNLLDDLEFLEGIFVAGECQDFDQVVDKL